MSEPPLIAVIHTSPATAETFGRLLKERVPACRVMNILDDSILPQLRENGGDTDAVLPRWRGYVAVAKERGARLVLNACSSIGALCAPVERELGLPVVRVDSRMAEEAVRRGRRIAVVATLASTLSPTSDLLEATAAAAQTEIKLQRFLVEGAYEALIGGDQARHDDLVAATLDREAAVADVVVLAQASMARVVPRLAAEDRAKFLTSPPFAVEGVAARLADFR